jgi:membrane associated rhomboid family serine protease
MTTVTDDELAARHTRAVRAAGIRAAFALVLLVASLVAESWPGDEWVNSAGFYGMMVALLFGWVSGSRWWALRKLPPPRVLEPHEVQWVAAQAAERSQIQAAHQAHLRVRAPIYTYALIGAVGVVYLLQKRLGIESSVERAGLVKPDVRAGQWYRLFTAPYLHAGMLHLAMNASALLSVGRLGEAYLPPLRLPLAYVCGLLGGSLVSMLLTPTASVGASGAILGLIGFLWLAARRRPTLLPPGLARGLGSSIVLTGALGLFGYRYIDNGGHIGGTLAGVLLAHLMYPPERGAPAVVRPGRERTLDVAGRVAVGVLLLAAAFTALLLAW